MCAALILRAMILKDIRPFLVSSAICNEQLQCDFCEETNVKMYGKLYSITPALEFESRMRDHLNPFELLIPLLPLEQKLTASCRITSVGELTLDCR